MKEWHDLLRTVLLNGENRPDRTGIGTKSLFGLNLELSNTSNSFPAVTTKKLAVRQCFGELAAFLEGAENLEVFHKHGCTIWDGNANAKYWQPRTEGDVGRIYGAQWREWRSEDTIVDQLADLISSLQKDPYSRRHLVTAFNPGELHLSCLPPCHVMFQCYVSNRLHLDLQVTMRSVDLFLGLPFDIASYALLQRLIAKEIGLQSRRLVFTFGDAHIYNNHLDAVGLALSRKPLKPPHLYLEPGSSIFKFKPAEARLINYVHYDAIKADLNV